MLLRSLSDLIRAFKGQGRKPNAATYDLHPHDIADLGKLTSYEEYKTYLALLDNITTYKAESLIHTDDPIQNAFLRGQIAALRETPLLIERLTHQNNDRSQSQRPDRTADRSARRSAALYATPGWSGNGSGS